VDVGLWLLVFAINLIALVGVLALQLGGISTMLTIVLALSLMPAASWIVWGTLYLWMLGRWRVEQVPTRLESALVELRGRTGVSFRRVLCLDDCFGAGRRCEVLTAPAGPTLIVSAAVAISIDDLELLALLAHEAGHIRLGHVGKRVVVGTVAGFLFALAGTSVLYVLYSWLPVALVPGLVVAVVLANIRGIYLTGLVRAQELEADAFAADVAGAEALRSALAKLGFMGPRTAVVHHRWTTHGTWELRSNHLRGQGPTASDASHS
jgi:Zn-dependent protease with chaperone function